MQSSKDAFVDLIDQSYDEADASRLVVYFPKERADVKNLVSTFQNMDFTLTSASQLNRHFNLDEFSHSNVYMVLDTRLDDDDDSDDCFDAEDEQVEEDLIEFE